MIPFEEIWLPQIVGYCNFVIDSDQIKRAWINKDHSNTSVTNFDELYEQLFDDLDSDSFDRDLPSLMDGKVEEYRAISEFLGAIRDASSAQSRNKNLYEARYLLESSEWLRVTSAAERVVRMAKAGLLKTF